MGLTHLPQLFRVRSPLEMVLLCHVSVPWPLVDRHPSDGDDDGDGGGYENQP